WRAGLVAPGLPALLRLCYALDVRLVDFLSADFRASVRDDRTQRLSPRSDYRQWTPGGLEDALRTELTQPVPTLTAVERRLGCNRKTLRKHQSELGAEVVAAGRERRIALERERTSKLTAEVETVVQHLIDARVLPTRAGSQRCWLAPAHGEIQQHGERCELQWSGPPQFNHNRTDPRFNHKRAKPARIWLKPPSRAVRELLRLVEAAGVEPASEAEFVGTSTSVSRILISARGSSWRDPLWPAAVSVPGRDRGAPAQASRLL